MEIGFKLFQKSIDLIEEYKGLFDYFEIMEDLSLKPSILKNLEVPVTIHAPHSTYGFDPGNKQKEDLNKMCLEYAIRDADITNSEFIVVHPGLQYEKDSYKNMIKFFKQFNDPRIIIENCPLVNKLDKSYGKYERYLASTPIDMKHFQEETNLRLCLDFSHAIVTANLLDVNPNKFIEEFMELNPAYFHVSGLDINSKLDNHKDLFEVDNTFEFLKYVGNKKLTLETSYQRLREKEAQIKNLEIVNRYQTTL